MKRPIACGLSLLILAALAPAAELAVIPMAQVSSCVPLATEMSACVRERPASFAELNQQNLLVPMTLPVRINTSSTGGLTLQPLIITDTVPADAVMMPMNVPVRFTETANQRCLTTTVGDDLAGLTILMPASVNGQQVLEPVQLKKDEHRLMVLPTRMETAEGQMRVPLYVNGELVTFPLDWRTTADGITFCPHCPAEQVILLTR